MSEETQQNSQPETLPSDAQPVEAAVQTPIASHRSPLRRLGCGCALLFWFLLLLSPCVFIVLATQGQITFSQGDLPGQELRIWLIQEAKEQGLGISTTSVLQIQPMLDMMPRCRGEGEIEPVPAGVSFR